MQPDQDRKQTQQPADAQEIEAEGDRQIAALRSALGKLAKHGKSDVFVAQVLADMGHLASVAVEAANKGVLRVTERHFASSQMLLDAFGESERLLRYTCRVNPSEQLFSDPIWRQHFVLTSSLAISRAINEIRAVILVDQHSHIDAPHVKKVLEFFATQEGLNAKVVVTGDYDACAADHGISSAWVEFGIYGDQLLYQAEGYAPVSVGSWCKDAIDINRFGRFFDSLWNTQIALNNPASPAQKVSLSQVLAADEATSPNRAGIGDIAERLQKRINSALPDHVGLQAS